MSACVSTMENRAQHAALIENVDAGKYDAAVEVASGDKFYPENNSELLRRMERGTALYRAGKLYQALQEFDAAKNYTDQYFKARTTRLLNDNGARYFGTGWERSNIRFYQSLIHYELGESGKYEAYKTADGISIPEKILDEKERRFHKTAAIAVAREWDSVFANLRADAAGGPGYKSDITESLWAAFLHGTTGASVDRSRAVVLYKRARENLFKNYNIYPAFNKKWEKFADNYRRLANLPEAAVKKDYIEPTPFAVELEKYIDDKIKNAGKDNFAVVVKDGRIADKQARVYPLTFNADEILRGGYVAGLLTAAFGGNAKNVSHMAFITWAVGTLLHGLEFELPFIVEKSVAPMTAELTGASGAKIRVPIVVSSPLSDVAFYEIDSELPAERVKVIARTTMGYVGAAATAYFTYNQVRALNEKNNNPLAEILAVAAAAATFRGLASGVEASNRADLRQWKLLPNAIRIGSAAVPAGKYKLRLLSNGAELYASDVEVGAAATLADVNLR